MCIKYMENYTWKQEYEENQKINGVGRIKFRINMPNSESAYSLIMGDQKFSEFTIVGM